MKSRSMLVCILALCAMLSGCMETIPLDEYGYVLSIGVDKGETCKFNISFMIQLEGQSQESEAGAGAYIVSAEGDSLFEAITVANLAVPYKLNFSRTNYLAFAKEIAEANGIEEFLMADIDTLGIRRSVKTIVVLGSCNEYFKGLNSKNNPNVSKRQFSLFQSYSLAGVIPMTNLTMLKEAAHGGRFDAMLAIGEIDTSVKEEQGGGTGGGAGDGSGNAQSEDNTDGGTTAGVKRDGGLRSYSLGCAVLDGMKLAAVLNGEDTQILLMANGKFETGRIGYHGEHGYYEFMLEKYGEPKFELRLGEPVEASLNIMLECRIVLDTAGDATQQWENGLRDEIEEYIEKELQRVFLLCRDSSSDAMGFGRYAAKYFKSNEEWREFDWKKKYSSLEVAFNADIKRESMAAEKLEGQ